MIINSSKIDIINQNGYAEIESCCQKDTRWQSYVLNGVILVERFDYNV